MQIRQDRALLPFCKRWQPLFPLAIKGASSPPFSLALVTVLQKLLRKSSLFCRQDSLPRKSCFSKVLGSRGVCQKNYCNHSASRISALANSCRNATSQPARFQRWQVIKGCTFCQPAQFQLRQPNQE